MSNRYITYINFKKLKYIFQVKINKYIIYINIYIF